MYTNVLRTVGQQTQQAPPFPSLPDYNGLLDLANRAPFTAIDQIAMVTLWLEWNAGEPLGDLRSTQNQFTTMAHSIIPSIQDRSFYDVSVGPLTVRERYSAALENFRGVALREAQRLGVSEVPPQGWDPSTPVRQTRQRLDAMQSQLAALGQATPSVYPPYDDVALRARVDALQSTQPFDSSSLQQRMSSLQKQHLTGLISLGALVVFGGLFYLALR